MHEYIHALQCTVTSLIIIITIIDSFLKNQKLVKYSKIKF
jgi:hypothetical protein